MNKNTENINTEYRGFEITPWFKIIKGGKFVFSNRHTGDCVSLKHAKDIIDMSLDKKAEQSNYQQYQENRFENPLPPVEVEPDGTCENGVEELERFQEWVELQNEIQMYESEY